MIESQRVPQHVLQRRPEFLRAHLRAAAAKLIQPEASENTRVNGEFVPVDLGKDRVEVHEGAHVGDVQDQDALNGTAFIPEEAARQQFDPLRGTALRQTDGQQILPEVEDVPSLDVERIVPVVIEGDLPGKVRMKAHDIVPVYGLPAARDRVHAVETDAAADAREGIAGEIQVRDRIEDKLAALPRQTGKRPDPQFVAHFPGGHTAHGLEHEFPRIPDRHEHGVELLRVVLRKGPALTQKLPDKYRLQSGVGAQRLGHQILEIDDLRPLLAEDGGKGVVLLLRQPQIGDIVEKQALEFLRDKMLQLFARPVEQDLFQRPDLAFHTDRHGHPSLSFLSIVTFFPPFARHEPPFFAPLSIRERGDRGHPESAGMTGACRSARPSGDTAVQSAAMNASIAASAAADGLVLGSRKMPTASKRSAPMQACSLARAFSPPAPLWQAKAARRFSRSVGA